MKEAIAIGILKQLADSQINKNNEQHEMDKPKLKPIIGFQSAADRTNYDDIDNQRRINLLRVKKQEIDL